MKYSTAVSSKAGKQRAMHFSASPLERRKRMSVKLSKELQDQYHVRCLPVRREDTVRVMVGKQKDVDGKVVAVYRRRYVIHVERVTVDTKRGETKSIGINPSNCVITKLHLDKDRKALLERKNREKLTTRSSCNPAAASMSD